MPVPPPMDNHGKYVISLGRLLKWFEPKLEEVGVEVFCEFPAAEALQHQLDLGCPQAVPVVVVVLGHLLTPSVSRPM